ncbi:MAG: hypothetical protein GXY50_01905 [Syntrophomonadaceae bacterium]|nr:hypothetical protein [Syntrophomonadaceae bacterium]
MSQGRSFKEFCDSIRELSLSKRSPEDLVIEGQLLVSEFLENPDLMLDNLITIQESMLDEDFWPIDVNDIVTYRDPNRNFSVRLFVWEPNFPYHIHDHGSWGIMGCLANQIRETKYRLIGTQDDCEDAELKVMNEAILQPGHTTFVLPLDRGIHRMQAFGNKPALSVHVYGKPSRVGFIRGFTPETNSAYKMYPVIIQRRVMAAKALELIGTDWAQEILKMRCRDNNEMVSRISREALERLEHRKDEGEL